MPILPNGVQLPDVGTRAVSLATSIFAPFLTLHDMNVKLWGSGAQSAALTASIAVCFISWIGCMFGELGSVNASYVGWVLYTCMVALITYVRMKAREAYNGESLHATVLSRPSFLLEFLMYTFSDCCSKFVTNISRHRSPASAAQGGGSY